MINHSLEQNLIKLSKKAKKFNFKKMNGSVKKFNLMDKYVKRLIKNFNQKKKINIIWDSGNGAAGDVMNALAKNIDGKYELLFSEIDGTFPNHHPDPSDPKNLVFCKINF